MATQRKRIERHLSEPALDEAIDDAESAGEAYLLRRLICLKGLYAGETLAAAGERVGVSKGTVSRWTDRWNEGGVDGLRPAFDGGPTPKLSPDEAARFQQLLREGEPWTYAEVRDLLRAEFGVEYSAVHLRRKIEEYGLSNAVD